MPLRRVYAERFRRPGVRPAATDTYRTFLLRELPLRGKTPERRRTTVPDPGAVRMGISPSILACAARNRQRRRLSHRLNRSTPGTCHRRAPDLVRARLIALADETA